MKETEQISTQIFGRKYRLAIAFAIHGLKGKPFTAMTLSQRIGIFYPRVHTELQLLVKAQLLSAVDGPANSVEYRARPSPIWEFCAALMRQAQKSAE